RGGGGFGGPAADPQEAERMREVMREILDPPKHLIIANTGSMVILTGPDGRTLRLSPDGKKVKDDSTKIERKTKWDRENLISEVSGLGQGKITETYAMDAERHQLRVTVQVERPQTQQARTFNHVYDLDPK